ncbi:MAG TPA: DUF1588 domain-containing protein, partial [Planctomycetaceae bacterium]|nr:DUF1588 domain-containing protein [Planctomycetaceae bacterium]
QIAADLRVSLDLFLDDVVWSDRSDFRNLLLSNEIYLNGRLAKYYGYDLPEDAPFQKVPLEPDFRAGLLTHPYLMAGYAYTDSSSPIHRGVFLTRNVLGRFLKPPPIAVAPTPVDLAPDMTTRERVTIQTRETLCMSCHGMINDLGFSLEQFDAVGRFRKQERGRDVDASGRYVKRSGEEVLFEGARELAGFLAESDDSQNAFTEFMFQYFVKQPVQAFEPEMLPRLRQQFVDDNYHIRQLLARIATESAIRAKELDAKRHNPND